LFRRLLFTPVNWLPTSGLPVFDTWRCHTLKKRFLASVDMRVSNEHSGDGYRLPQFRGTVDWAWAEARAEAEFAAQRVRLQHRLHDRDYPYPQVIEQLVKLITRNFD